jgi:hypothetical protein
MEKTYTIEWRYNPGADWEVIEENASRDDLDYLLGEYSLAFGGGEFRVEEE